MKLCNIKLKGETHLAVMTERGVVDTTAAGATYRMEQLFGKPIPEDLIAIEHDLSLPVVESPEFANVVERADNIICVGLNYRSHAEGVGLELPKYPLLFSKFSNALAASGEDVVLPPWERSYDYEAELVIVIGKGAWNISEAEADDCIFGYSCGNDLSCRAAQGRTSQWLIGKTMPGFAPCGPVITTADSFDADAHHSIKSYVNGTLRQDGTTQDMIFNCRHIVSYASKYIKLCPGDLIFTGTPSGVALEAAERNWPKSGDVVDICIEGIGTLTNRMI